MVDSANDKVSVRPSSRSMNLLSASIVALIGAIPWVLFASLINLAVLAPLSLFIVYLICDKYEFKYSFLLVPLGLIAYGSLLIKHGAIPEGSPNYRFLIRLAIVSLLPFLYLVTRNQKVRKIVAVNALVLIVGVFVIEGTLRVISPKKIEQDKWSELLSKYAEAPKPEVDPVISEIAYGRITTDSPKTYDHRIFFYGGSTTFGKEVSDKDTYPSQTQRMFNSAGEKVVVENRGVIGAAAVHLIPGLLAELGDDQMTAGPNKGHIRQRINNGDIVVFYIGVNEAKNAIFYRNPIARLSGRFTYFENTSNWIFKNTNLGYLLNNLLGVGQFSIDENSLSETNDALNQMNDYVSARGGIFLPVLQVNSLTRSDPLAYEIAIRESMNDFPDAIEIVYPRLAEMIRSFEHSADARSIFDNLETSPFFDWCHTDKLGNQKIAEFMYELIHPFIKTVS